MLIIITFIFLDYNKKSQDIFRLLNEYRKNPRILSRHLEGLKKYIDNSNVLQEPGKIPIQMVEGVAVIDEAIQFLNGLKSLPPLELDKLLCQSAKEHVDDIGLKGLLSYQSSDGTEPEDRIAKYGNYVEALGENIDFGPNDALGVIVSLTLDDGEEERPHRDNIFKSDYKKIGIACGPHKSEFQMCVMDFAYDFLPHNQDLSEDNAMNNNMENDIKISGQLNNNFNNNLNNNNQKNQNFPQNNQINNNQNVNNYPQVNMDHQPQQQKKVTNQNQNQSPIVPVSIDPPKIQQSKNIVNNENNFNQGSQIVSLSSEINEIISKKKVISKYVEIVTKVIYTYEDGSKKETVEKDEHTFKY